MRKRKLSPNSVIALLSSMKTALVLISILIVLSILGSLIPQGMDLSFYLEKYGEAVGNSIVSLHLDNFFRSWIFLFFTGLFFLNLLTCSVLRFYRRINRKAPLRIGPDIIHLSLLLIMVLGLFALFTRQETHILIGVGESFRLPEGTEVTLSAFDIEYYEDGRPKDWISRIILKGDETREHFIEVNKPLKHGAYSIFQSSYDLKPYAIVEAGGHEYELGKRDGLPLESGVVYLVNTREGNGEIQGVFYYSEDQNEFEEIILKDGDIFHEMRVDEIYSVKQSGLQIVYQPGNGFILAALLLFCIGLAVTFYQKLGDEIK